MDIITQRFIAIGNKILAELRGMRVGIEKQTDAIDRHENAQQERAESQQRMQAELHLPQPDIDKKKGRNKYKKWLHPQTIVQALTLLAVIYYACYAKKQWEAMHETYGEIHAQTEQITRQTSLLRREMEGYQAAIVQMKIYLEPGATGFFAQVLNFGHVISPTVHIHLDIFKQRYSTHPSMDKRIMTFDKQITQLPPVVISPGQDPWDRADTIIISQNITVEEAALMTPERPTIIAKGTVVFDTGFDRSLPVEECWVYLSYPTYQRKDGQKGGGGGSLIPCEQRDNAITNYINVRKATE